MLDSFLGMFPEGAGGLVFGVVWLLYVVTLICAIVFWVTALIDCRKHEAQSNTKRLWTLAILGLNIVGAILYLVIRRPERIRELGGRNDSDDQVAEELMRLREELDELRTQVRIRGSPT